MAKRGSKNRDDGGLELPFLGNRRRYLVEEFSGEERERERERKCRKYHLSFTLNSIPFFHTCVFSFNTFVFLSMFHFLFLSHSFKTASFLYQFLSESPPARSSSVSQYFKLYTSLVLHLLYSIFSLPHSVSHPNQ
jgi:ABC-type phosphate transport system permease subunit